MAGTGIGTFSDRLRDAARGGSGFGDPREQGFVTGLWYEPNGHWQGREENLRTHLLYLTDLVRLGLAANLADYELVTSWGRGCAAIGLTTTASPPATPASRMRP